MKRSLLLVLVLMLTASLVLGGCTPVEPGAMEPGEEEPSEVTVGYDNGRYRGIFADRGAIQVGLQFHLEDGVLTDVSYRSLDHGGNDYRGMEEDHAMYPVKQQHDQIIDLLEGKSIEDADNLLRNTGDFIDDVDGFTGATIRGTKILSAVQDGLNRGLYRLEDDSSRVIGDYDDGRYRGIFADRGAVQVGIQFHLENGVLTDLSLRSLDHSGNDYRGMEEDHAMYAVKQQHDQALEYLEGKPLEAIFDLHSPGDFIEDIDGFTGATIRGAKIFSAIKDGLNRELYRPGDEYSTEVGDHADGRYRGIFADRGDIQVGLQFYLEGGLLKDLSFRSLDHGGNDYRAMEEGHAMYPVKQQHDQALAYLEGKPLEAIFDLHSPGDFIDDVDGFTGATIRGAKIFSAIKDGLNRGIY